MKIINNESSTSEFEIISQPENNQIEVIQSKKTKITLQINIDNNIQLWVEEIEKETWANWFLLKESYLDEEFYCESTLLTTDGKIVKVETNGECYLVSFEDKTILKIIKS